MGFANGNVFWILPITFFHTQTDQNIIIQNLDTEAIGPVDVMKKPTELYPSNAI